MGKVLIFPLALSSASISQPHPSPLLKGEGINGYIFSNIFEISS
jgi:hypothetical protein